MPHTTRPFPSPRPCAPTSRPAGRWWSVGGPGPAAHPHVCVRASMRSMHAARNVSICIGSVPSLWRSARPDAGNTARLDVQPQQAHEAGCVTRKAVLSERHPCGACFHTRIASNQACHAPHAATHLEHAADVDRDVAGYRHHKSCRRLQSAAAAAAGGCAPGPRRRRFPATDRPGCCLQSQRASRAAVAEVGLMGAPVYCPHIRYVPSDSAALPAVAVGSPLLLRKGLCPAEEARRRCAAQGPRRLWANQLHPSAPGRKPRGVATPAARAVSRVV